MGRKILGFLSAIMFCLSIIGISVIIYAEKNPGNSLFKPRPFVTEAKTTNIPEINVGENDIKIKDKFLVPLPYIELNVPVIFQNPRYPTGCEPVSAVMLLNYYGFNISADKFIEETPLGSYPYMGNDGKRYGPDPNKVFVGNPELPTSWGIYAEGLKKVIDSVLADSSRANSGGTRTNARCIDISGCSIEELLDLLQEGKPVIVWATINMEKATEGMSWYIEDTGEFFTWIRKEHCYVLLGYDEDGNLIFNDPLDGRVVYSQDVFLKAFESLGRQALYISSLDF